MTQRGKGKSKGTVLQVLPNLVAGGVERGTIDIARYLKQEGWTPLVASNGGGMVNDLIRLGIEHIRLPLHKKNPLSILNNIRLLAKLIEEKDVDIVHARSRAPAWSACYAARKTGAGFVTTFHGTYNFKNTLKRTYNSVMTRGNPVIAISQHIASHMHDHYGVEKKRIRLIPRGVDISYFDPEKVPPSRMVVLSTQWRVPDDKLIIMMPGRLARWKGQWFLLEALHDLNSDDYYCLIVGDQQQHSGYLRELEEKVDRLGLRSKVRFVGHCNDMAAAYMLSDIVVCPSQDPEAFGRVAAEAQAMGRIVIASNHGGAPEIIDHNKTGYLFDPHEKRHLVEALRQAMALSTLDRKRISARAITNIRENFTITQMQQRTLTVYREVLQQSS